MGSSRRRITKIVDSLCNSPRFRHLLVATLGTNHRNLWCGTNVTISLQGHGRKSITLTLGHFTSDSPRPQVVWMDEASDYISRESFKDPPSNG